jgi:hypothetical protein
MKIKIKETYICRGCKQLIKHKVEMKFGDWEYKCKVFNIGRNENSDNCDRHE